MVVLKIFQLSMKISIYAQMRARFSSSCEKLRFIYVIFFINCIVFLRVTRTSYKTPDSELVNFYFLTVFLLFFFRLFICCKWRHKQVFCMDWWKKDVWKVKKKMKIMLVFSWSCQTIFRFSKFDDNLFYVNYSLMTIVCWHLFYFLVLEMTMSLQLSHFFLCVSVSCIEV